VTATVEPGEGGPGADGRGELHVAGPASARHTGGRDKRPRPARGWPTGDLAALDDGDQLRLLGRLVDSYLSAGRLVVPLEVEVALGADPGLAEVAVVPRPDPHVGAIGVAVTVPADPEVPPFLSDLADGLADLPPEARPTAQCVIGELPLSAGGHVHRRLLAFEEASR
jgi:acyl-CoA synthetase (AMP-forming)/AMP-acid ligase II